MIKKHSLILVILLLALVLRVYKLGEIPVSLFMDEASVGYDAFSLRTSGMDQWGVSWPLIFKSFGEYKYPWHIYAALVSGSLIGWTEFSIRLPSALMGVLNVYLLYLLTMLISGKRSIALLAAFFLAVSPWHIQFTRMAWESGYVLFFLFFGLWLFQKGRINQGRWLIPGAIFLGLSMFAYNAAKVVTPLLFGWTYYLYSQELNKKLKLIVYSTLIFVFFVAISFGSSTLSGVVRFDQVGVGESVVRSTELFKLTHNYWIGLIQVWSYQYLSHFGLTYLIISGDINPRHSIQSMGQLMICEFIFVLIGVFRIWKLREKWLIWILGWIIISPIPAALTNNAPHALRSILGLGGWQIIAAAGAVYLIDWVRSVKYRSIYVLMIILIVVVNILYFLYSYFVVYPANFSNDWQYGYSEIFKNNHDFNKYDGVIVSDRYSHPYIFMAWQNKISFQTFHNGLIYNEESKKTTSLISRLGNVYFEAVNFYELPMGKLLIFAHPSEKLSEISENRVIKNPDGTIAFYVYEYENK